jgi:hypothetical protein
MPEDADAGSHPRDDIRMTTMLVELQTLGKCPKELRKGNKNLLSNKEIQ